MPNNKSQLIYVGIGYFLEDDTSTLDAYDITSLLNVAYDLNDPQSLQPKNPIKKNGKIQYFSRQLAKVGLIDGPENDMMTLIGAIYMADLDRARGWRSVLRVACCYSISSLSILLHQHGRQCHPNRRRPWQPRQLAAAGPPRMACAQYLTAHLHRQCPHMGL